MDDYEKIVSFFREILGPDEELSPRDILETKRIGCPRGNLALTRFFDPAEN